MVNIGSTSTGGRVVAIKADLAKIELLRYIFINIIQIMGIELVHINPDSFLISNENFLYRDKKSYIVMPSNSICSI